MLMLLLAENFLINLQAKRPLYCEMIKYGFIYPVGLSTFNDSDFEEIQKLSPNNHSDKSITVRIK